MNKVVTLAFLVKDNRVILAEKKKGFGKGFLNGYGGGVKKNESILDCLARELFEESGVRPKEVRLVGQLDFYKLSEKLCHCCIYFVSEWEGDPTDTQEMGIPQEFFIDAMPFHQMWHGDKFWLPLLLRGEKIFNGYLEYSGDMKKVNSIKLVFY